MTGPNWAFRFQRLTFPGPRGTILLRFSFFADRFHWLLQSLHTVQGRCILCRSWEFFLWGPHAPQTIGSLSALQFSAVLLIRSETTFIRRPRPEVLWNCVRMLTFMLVQCCNIFHRVQFEFLTPPGASVVGHLSMGVAKCYQDMHISVRRKCEIFFCLKMQGIYFIYQYKTYLHSNA